MTERCDTAARPSDAHTAIGETMPTTTTIADKGVLLNDAVERALVRWPAGVTMHMLDPNVRWATGQSLSQWASALGQRTRAGLLRALPAVGAVDNIAGHVVIYPARSRDRLRDVSRRDSGSDATARDLCGPDVLRALAARGMDVVVVDTVGACRDAVDHIRRCGQVGFDCEGTSVVRPGTASPGVALIQMAVPDGPCYLFDMCRPEPTRSARALMHHGGLGALLADRSVTKVVHDVREDARALAVAHGCHVAGVFDTQVVHMRLTGRNAPRLGLNAVLAEHGLATNQHKDAMRAIYPIDLYAWHRREFFDWMIEYAVSDVHTLLRLKDALVARLLAAAPAPPWAVGLLPSPSPRPARCWAVVATARPIAVSNAHDKRRDANPPPASSSAPTRNNAAAVIAAKRAPSAKAAPAKVGLRGPTMSCQRRDRRAVTAASTPATIVTISHRGL
nr:3'5' exonuclease [Pandoravirus massiliensis]